MATRRTRFTAPVRNPRKRTRTLQVPVSGGIHRGVPPHEVPLGFTPQAQNFVPNRDGWIAPRSGLSQFGTYDFGGPVIGASEVYDVNGNAAAFAPSYVSISYFHPTDAAWSELSYVPGTVASSMTDGAVSGTSTDYFEAISVYDLQGDRFIGIFSNGTNAVKFFPVVAGASPNTYSDFTWVDSLSSVQKVKTLNAVNDRVVFANITEPDGTRYPTRLLWSARGDPTNYAIASEAGFEDLMEMRGEILALRRFRDFLILFTENEIWRATPTLDAYAFRFDRVVDSIGCPWPKTAVPTPYGVIFLGHDKDVYVTDGASVLPIGPLEVGAPSRIQRILVDDATNLERAWAAFSHTESRYELYFPQGGNAEGYPDSALFYKMPEKSWWLQDFGSLGLSSGVDLPDPGEFTLIDEMGDLTFDEVDAGIDSFDVFTKAQRMNVFDSLGTTLRFRSEQTNDDGTAIDVRWRSPGFGGYRRVHLTEVWTDYEAASASSASVYVGAARDSGAFDSGTAISLTTSGAPIFTPTWKTGTAPNFELRLSDGGTPRIASFQATLKDASKF